MFRPEITRYARFALLMFTAACLDPASPRTPLAPDAALRGLGSASWQVSYIGSDWYPRVRSWAVNDSNVVVGSAQTGANIQTTTAFRAAGGALQLLALGNGRISHVARGINSSGEIVGFVSRGGGFYDTAPQLEDSAFYRNAAGITTILPTNALTYSAGAFDINEAGSIAGFGVGDPDAYLWTRSHNGAYVANELAGPLPDGVALNGAGVVVGTSWALGVGALRLSLNGWQDLSDAGYCASDINDGNMVVGVGPDSSIVYTFGFGMISIGVKAVERNCRGDAPRISNKGRLVGTRTGQGAFTRIYGTIENLPLPAGASFAFANSVNTCGTIAGTVVSKTTGLQRGVIWRRMAVEGQICD